MLVAEGVRVRYGAREALAGVELTAREGRVLGLIGPNGSGKTTLLQAFLRAVDARGKLLIGGDEIHRLTSRARAQRLAAVSQSEEAAAEITVADLVLLGRSVYRSGWSNYRTVDNEAAQNAMRRTGVFEMRNRPISELSGGERQRVLIARAVAQGSRYLLLDEPTNHLDIRYQHEVLSLVRDIGLVTVVVLHDLNLAARYCDDLVLLQDGLVAASGSAREVLNPQLLEQVYGLHTTPVEVDGVLQIVFAPRCRPADKPGDSAHCGHH